MITPDILVARFPGLELGQLQEWIAEGMLRAELSIDQLRERRQQLPLRRSPLS